MVLKVGGQKVICERIKQKKFLYPPHLEKSGVQFLTRGGTSKEGSIIIEYTEICCLVVALIHIS